MKPTQRIANRLARWLYPEICKLDEVKEVARSWQLLPKCPFCGKALTVECTFCMHCGTPLASEHPTTDRIPPVVIAEQQPPRIDTHALNTTRVPGQMPAKTWTQLQRIKRWRDMVHGD